jgi:hypothetical protein
MAHKVIGPKTKNNLPSFQNQQYIGNFMSFCRILSTLCRQVIFHIVLHFGKRAGQKVQRKIARAVQKVKSPLLFVPLF